jgi:hypothetical protein
VATTQQSQGSEPQPAGDGRPPSTQPQRQCVTRGRARTREVGVGLTGRVWATVSGGRAADTWGPLHSTGLLTEFEFNSNNFKIFQTSTYSKRDLPGL